MGINSSKFSPSTNNINQHAAEPAGPSGSNVTPLSGPAGSATPGMSSTLPRAADRNGNGRFRRWISRTGSLGGNTAGQPNRGPLIVDANQLQNTAALDQSAEAASVQQADAASSAQREVASRHSAADGSGAEPVSRSPSLLEAGRALDWILPLVDAEYRPQAGPAIPAAATASTAPTGNADVPVFAKYGRPFSLDIAVREALKSINPLVTVLLNLNTIVEEGTVGPALDKELVKTFNLDMQLEHRFVEKEIDGRRRTFVFSYSPGKRWIESVHLVEFEGASTSPLRANQKVRINGVKRTLSIERERGSRQLVRVGLWVNTRLKAIAKGVQTRLAQQREFQAITPYPNRAHYALATKAFGGATGNSSARTEHTAEEWKVYRSTAGASLLKDRSAVLHSFRMKGHLQGALAELEAPPRKGKDAVIPLGHIYRPENIHNMKVNSAWMLGLAHHQVPAVLTTPLTSELLLRRTRKDEDVEPLSALCRELVGLLQNGYFRVQTNESGRKTLVPTEEANAATLKSMQVPRGRDLKEVIAFLEKKGLPVVAKAEDVPPTTSKFDAGQWWRELLVQDLEGPDDSFPNLNTLIYSGVEVPLEMFKDVLETLNMVTSQEFQNLAETEDFYEARIPDLLVAMVNGLTNDHNAVQCLTYLALHLSVFTRTRKVDHVAEKIIDCIHRRAVEIEDVRMRMDQLDCLMHNIIASEALSTPGNTEHFPLLEHALNAKVLNPHYQMLRAVRITDAMYEKLPLTGALCKTAVADIDKEDHPGSKRAIHLGLKVVDSLKSQRERYIGLKKLADGIGNATDPHEREFFATQVMERLSSLADPADEDLIAQKVGYSLIWAEVDAGDAHAEVIMKLLEDFNIPLRRDLAFAAIDEIQSKSGEEQYYQMKLASALVRAAPQREGEEISEQGAKQLIRFIDALEFIQPAEVIEPGSDEPHQMIEFAVDFMRAYLDEVKISASRGAEIEDALTMSLINIRTITPQHAIEILGHFGVSDVNICLAVSTQLDLPDGKDKTHVLNFLMHVANTMGAESRAVALRSLLQRAISFPFAPEAKEIVETVAAHINASKTPGALDPMDEVACAGLSIDLACAMVNFNVLEHQHPVEMLLACAFVPDVRALMSQAFSTGAAQINDVQMRAIDAIFDQIERARTAEERDTDNLNVQVLGYLAKSLSQIAANDTEVFNELQRFLKATGNAPMTEEDRCYLAEQLIDSLWNIDVGNTDAQIALIGEIGRNLENVFGIDNTANLSRDLIEAGESIFLRAGGEVAWRNAVDIVAKRFRIDINSRIEMGTANLSAFVLGLLP